MHPASWHPFTFSFWVWKSLLNLSPICAESAQHVVHPGSRNVLTLSLFWVSKSPLILTCSQSESLCRICATRSAPQFLACFSVLSPRSVVGFSASTNLSRNCLSSQPIVPAESVQPVVHPTSWQAFYFLYDHRLNHQEVTTLNIYKSQQQITFVRILFILFKRYRSTASILKSSI